MVLRILQNKRGRRFVIGSHIAKTIGQAKTARKASRSQWEEFDTPGKDSRPSSFSSAKVR